MVLKIKLGEDREKRLARHLEKEHPSTRGNIKLVFRKRKSLKTTPQINKIVKDVPDYKKQASKFTRI